MEENGLDYEPERSLRGSEPAGVHAFEFTGTAKEYFSIWIVNVCLSVLTLGLYYPWAKVRTRRYFYSNLVLDGSSFRYTAEPTRLLLGHLLVVAYLAALFLSSETVPALSLGLMLAAAALLPWMVVGSLSFQRRNSMYRNVRFGFDGTVREAAGIFLGGGIAILLTLGLAIPWLHGVRDQFAVSKTRYGRTPFTFDWKPGPYYGVILSAGFLYVFLVIGSVVLFGAPMTPEATAGAESLEASPSLGLIACLYLAYGVVFAVVKAGLTNLLYRNARLGKHRFDSTLSPARLLWIYGSGALAVGLSMGMLFPWARVRLVRYRAQSLALLGSGSLDDFVAASEPEPGRDGVATELADAFDFGFAL